jgi:hypothetical protein
MKKFLRTYISLFAIYSSTIILKYFLVFTDDQLTTLSFYWIPWLTISYVIFSLPVLVILFEHSTYKNSPLFSTDIFLQYFYLFCLSISLLPIILYAAYPLTDSEDYGFGILFFGAIVCSLLAVFLKVTISFIYAIVKKYIVNKKHQ